MKRIFTAYPSSYVRCSQESPTSDELWDIVKWAAQEAGLAVSNYTSRDSNIWTFADWKTHGREVYIRLSDSDVRNIVRRSQAQSGGDNMKLRSLIAEKLMSYA